MTPKECFRLMGFADEHHNSASEAGVSNTQLYKQFGNSIVVTVLMAIFSQLNIKGVKPWNELTESEKQAFDKEEDEPMPVFLEGNSRLKGFEIDFNGEIVRGAVPTGAGVYISSQIDHLRASLLGTTREGVSCRWFSRMFMPGDRLKVKFDEFPVETLSVPMKVNFD